MTETKTTEEEKVRVYKAQREAFRKKKAELLLQIHEHQSSITGLEKQVEAIRPRTQNGEMTCDICDCVSMRYVGRTPQGGLSGGDSVYECEICGRTNYG
jgi:hypothetical protein